jgi:hypothetical protein
MHECFLVEGMREEQVLAQTATSPFLGDMHECMQAGKPGSMIASTHAGMNDAQCLESMPSVN